MTTITMAGVTWRCDPPTHLSPVGHKQYERGFSDRTYDYAYKRQSLNPYNRRCARQCWALGYDDARRQEGATR
jgi:hypothetical protein